MEETISDNEWLSALQRKQQTKQSILRTRRVRQPAALVDTPRGHSLAHDHPVLPYRRRPCDILGSAPFSLQEEDPTMSVSGSSFPSPLLDLVPAGLPQICVNGGGRRLVPRINKIALPPRREYLK
jgi:hypothetical protein